MAWLQIFLSLAITDILYAVYTKQVQNDKPVLASAIAAIMFSVSAFAVVSIVGDNWLIVPAVLGCFVGTYIGVKINKHIGTHNG